LAGSVPWVAPGNPGPFALPAGATGPQIEAAKDVWRNLQTSFEAYQATEKALIAQVEDALDPIYLRALLNRATGQYSTSLRSMVKHLFDTHGKITPQQVTSKQLSIYNMMFTIALPVDVVFNSVDDLVDLADHAGSALTDQQMIDLAYQVFSKEPLFRDNIRLWNRKPAADKTWANMLTHFRTAQTDLQSLNSPPPVTSTITPTAPTPFSPWLISSPSASRNSILPLLTTPLPILQPFLLFPLLPSSIRPTLFRLAKPHLPLAKLHSSPK
jgi:hypothetical protein